MVICSSKVLTLRRLLVICAMPLAFSFVSVAPAFAQDNVEQARERFMEGRTFYDNDQYEEAAEAFLDSYELSGRSELLYNVGQAYRLAGMLTEAETYFQRYLADLPGAPNADEVADTVIEIQQAIAASLATLTVTTSPAGATVRVEETDARCNAPCELDMAPGTYTLIASLPDHEQVREQVTLEARQRDELSLSLSASTRSGQLMVQTDLNGATLVVGTQSHALPLRQPISVDAGTTRFAIRGGGVDFADTVEVPADETLTLYIPSSAMSQGGIFSNPRQTAAVGLGGVGIALAAAAAIMGRQASAIYDSLEAQQSAFGGVNRELLDTGVSQQRTANGLWVGAAVSLLAGGGLYAWDRFSGGSADDAPEPSEEPAAEEPAPRRTDAPVELLD